MKNIIYSCHQPNFLPWIGYFHKIYISDIFVLLDNIQYTKNSVANRNKIKGPQGEQFITVPVSKKTNGSSFFSYLDAEIAQERWYEKAIKTIEQNYRKCKYFDKYKNVIFDILKIDNFSNMNISFIKFVLNEFEIKTRIFLLSEMKGIDGKKNELVINIGNYFDANIYLSGNGARVYNDERQFKENNIEIVYQKFNHPEYNQLNTSSFIPFLSIIDLLFNEGKDGVYFLKQ